MGVERTPLMKEIPREASAEEMSQSERVGFTQDEIYLLYLEVRH